MNFNRNNSCSTTTYLLNQRNNNNEGRTTFQSNNHNGNTGRKINVDDIIEYIEKNIKFINNPKTDALDIIEVVKRSNNTNNTFDTKKLEQLQFNKSGQIEHLPPNLQSIFGSMFGSTLTSFMRIGPTIYVNIPVNIDISYVSSILVLTVPDFLDLKAEEQIEYVQIFIRKMLKEARTYFDKFGYDKLGW